MGLSHHQSVQWIVGTEPFYKVVGRLQFCNFNKVSENPAITDFNVMAYILPASIQLKTDLLFID